MRELPLTGDMDATVNSCIDGKLPEAIRARSAGTQENIMQSMTVELDGRIPERMAHFATQDAASSVDGRVAAAQADLASIKDQVASFRLDERSRRSGHVKLESILLRMEQESDSN